MGEGSGFRSPPQRVGGNGRAPAESATLAARERFLVTGGAGFIGRHLTRALVEAGHFVRVVDDLSRGDRDALPDGCEWIEGSVLDLELCREACEGIDGVFHLAAVVETPTAVEAIDWFMQRNASGTQNLLVAARDGHVRKVVYGASRTAYGALPPPHTPDLVPDCLTPYALSKLVGEQLCAMFTRLYGLPTLSLRYADVYGTGQPAGGPYAGVLGRFIEQRMAGRPLTLHGDGAQERDFVHVADVVQANLCAYRASASGTTLNVGSGRSHSIKSIADMISSDQIKQPRPVGDADCMRAAIEETRDRIGWTPRVELADGLRALLVTARSR